MGKLIGNLDLRYHNAEDWELLADYSYRADNGDLLLCRKGNHSDLASIPKGLIRAIIPKLGRHTRGAIFHDGIYNGWIEIHDENGVPLVYNRLEADEVYREINQLTKEKKIIVSLIHLVLRWFGGISWDKIRG